ncbi:hypothetical protein SDC9_156225 [bioreactor metagenome]|uniref:Uncharacterized protein n=1 Tax=bioreactor metagenome TaxID=1076179 RepID=A0A645F446_9ZZZZ
MVGCIDAAYTVVLPVCFISDIPLLFQFLQPSCGCALIQKHFLGKIQNAGALVFIHAQQQKLLPPSDSVLGEFAVKKALAVSGNDRGQFSQGIFFQIFQSPQV